MSKVGRQAGPEWTNQPEPSLRERQLQLVLDSGPTLLAYIDTSSCFRQANKVCEQWFGLPILEIVGKSVLEVLGEATWQAIQPSINRALRGEKISDDQELSLKTGKRWVHATYTPDMDTAGVIRGFVVQATEIGDYMRLNKIQGTIESGYVNYEEDRQNFQLIQKATLNLLEDMYEERNQLDQTQRALLNMLEDIEMERARAEQAKALLESVNRELEAFSYSVSHDLRAPLRAISGFAQAVVEDYSPKLDDEGQRFLALIQDNAHRMGQLIDDLLTFSRLNRQQMTHTKVDVQEQVKSIFDELVLLSPGRQIKLAVHPVPLAYGDQAMIRQVLVNLLSNAIKFTRTREEALLEFGYLPDLEQGAYFLKDNGVGFEMKYVGKLFGVFQRLHSVTDVEGTGVGLALVYRIITRHGGRVWAEGQIDQGATFYFTLPEREAA